MMETQEETKKRLIKIKERVINMKILDKINFRQIAIAEIGLREKSWYT